MTMAMGAVGLLLFGTLLVILIVANHLDERD